MSYLNMNTNAAYNFIAPSIDADKDSKVEVAFPTAESKVLDYKAVQEVVVERQATVIDLGELTGATTVDLTIGSDVGIGALLTIVALSDTTARAVTCGTGFLGGAIAGTISKTKAQSYIYNGTKFVPISAAIQLD